MTDEERAELERRIQLYKSGLETNARGLGASARRIEEAVKAGAYDELDAPALAELVAIIANTIHRVAWYLDYKDSEE